MVKIRNESDLNNWFKKNYKKLGFSEMVRKDIGIFPDFIMIKDGKKVKVELETKLSNFILHKHPINEVDEIICVEKDVELKIPVIELKNFELVEYKKESRYSMKSQIYELFKKEKILTSSEIAEKLNVHWSTANSYLKELLIEKKVERMKKKGVTL